jgi:16S rRNA (guanine527-N7)-methyltransferase
LEDGDKARFAAHLNVSRETMDRLANYAALVRRWSARINLVSRSSMPHLWYRHILDSAQLMDHAPPGASRWLDFGSGAGFPGIVCAILAADRAPGLRLVLVESDLRKAAFLTTVIRETGIAAEVHGKRVEALPSQSADIISARAVAPLDTLLRLARPHAMDRTTLLFPKGSRYEEEIAAARSGWRFNVDARPSITEPSARVLVCRDVTPL